MRIFQSLFLGLFAALGLFGTAAVAVDWLQAVDTYTWESATCTIESSEVTRPGEYEYAVDVAYRYVRRGEEYRGRELRRGYYGSEDLGEAERLAVRYASGAEVECWVDPDDPERAYLLRANLWSGLWIFVPLLFAAVGGGALWFLHGFRKGSDATDERGEPLAPIPMPVSSARKKPSPFKIAGLLGAFFGVFFLVGAGLFLPFFVAPALRVLQARSWDEVPCTILSSGVRSHRSDDGATYSVEVLYRYEVNGREHRSNRYQFMGGSSGGYDAKADAVSQIPAGTETTCYVDPGDPFEAVVERGFTSDYLFGLVPLLFASVGLGGMVFVIVGARAVRKEAGRPSWGATIPPPRSPGAGETGSGARPGTGPIVLEPVMGRVGKLGCAIGVALLWNGITAPFVWIVVDSFRKGDPEWFVIVVVSPFVLIGFLLLTGIPYSVLGLLNPKPRVQLSQGVLRAGESVQIEWSFVGMAGRIRRVRIWLESFKTTTETVTTQRSASIRARTEPLETIDILDRVRDRNRLHSIESGSTAFTVPEDVLPSSDGEGATSWKLKVQGEIAFWPDVVEEYPIPVLGKWDRAEAAHRRVAPEANGRGDRAE